MSDFKGQTWKSDFNSSFGYSEDLRLIFQKASELKPIILIGNWNLMPYLVGVLGSAVNILGMATFNPKREQELKTKYGMLREKVRKSMIVMEKTRKVDVGLMYELEDFDYELHQQAQSVHMALTMTKEMGKKEQMKAAIRKG